MKIFKDRLDLTCYEPLQLLLGDTIDERAEALLEEAVNAFAEMASEVLFPRSAEAHQPESGDAVANRHLLVRENVRRYLLKAPASDLIAIQKYVKLKLRDYAIRDAAAGQRWN